MVSWAAQRRDVKTVARLLSFGASPNTRSRSGKTPLHWSVQSPTTECLEMLLAAKADVAATSISGRTALHNLADGVTEHPWLIKCLFIHGADLEKEDSDGMTPLSYAVCHNKPAIFLELVRAKLGTRNQDGQSLLHLAVFNNSHAVLTSLILQTNQDFQGIDRDDWDVFHFAACYADLECLKILEDKWPDTIDITREDKKSATACDLAARRKRDNVGLARAISTPPDHDPELWYDAFQRMVSVIQSRQGNDNGDGLASDEEGTESWEDAFENLEVEIDGN